MNKRIFALFCALALLLAACAPAVEQPPAGAYRVYFAVPGQEGAISTVDFEYRVPPAGTDPAVALINMLLAGPESTALASPLPAGVRLRSTELGEDGLLHLDLSEQYNGLPGVYLTVANACFVLTLTQLEGVKSLSITVEGKPLPYQAVQPLAESDLLLSGAEEEAVSLNAILYFARSQGDALAAEYRTVTKTEEASLPAAVLSALLEGPRYEGLTRVIPEGVKLLGVKLENGVCRVDLSREFTDKVPDKATEARLALYSMVNTLCALDGMNIESVQFTVEGQPIPLYGGLPTISPLEPNFSLAR